MSEAVKAQVEHAFRTNRRALVGYLTRMVVREDVAEDLVQHAIVRALEQDRLPEQPSALRAWLFRVATNLALDHLKKHSTWRETVLDETRARASASAAFVERYRASGGQARYVCEPSLGHSYGNVPGPDADRLIEQIARWLETAWPAPEASSHASDTCPQQGSKVGGT